MIPNSKNKQTISVLLDDSTGDTHTHTAQALALLTASQQLQVFITWEV